MAMSRHPDEPTLKENFHIVGRALLNFGKWFVVSCIFQMPCRMRFKESIQYRHRFLMLHRNGGPAVIYDDGEEQWYQYGQRHREDGPAAINGKTEYWFKRGKLHREGGPAKIRHDLHEAYALEWFKDGVRHNSDGPAWHYITKTGGETKHWWVDGRRHRIDGPAIQDGECLDWYVKGHHFDTINGYLDFLIKSELVTDEEALLIKLKWG